MEWFVDHLAIIMFAVLAIALFCGYPIAFVLGGIGLAFGLLGWLFDVFHPLQFFNILPRMYGSVAQNQVLVAVPMFIFMGTMMEKSGIAKDLLHAMQVVLRRAPGGLAISVLAMGTIMAASTGIVGASVIMLTLIALPAMIERNYNKELALGTIASSGTLGILIPPSIMLIIMGDQLSVPVGTLFAAAVIPGLCLVALYLIYIIGVALVKPQYAPPLPEHIGPKSKTELAHLLFISLLPPALLIFLVLGSIFLGWATPTEASGVGAAGAILLALQKKRLNRKVLREVFDRSASTNAMVFFIFLGATVFSYVFRALGGDDLVIDILNALGIDTGWELLIFMMGLIFILGFFLDWLEISLIVLPIFVPALEGVDFSSHGVPDLFAFLPWFAVLISVNLQTSFLTPPFGYTLFFLKGAVPKSIAMNDIYRGIIPFVIIQLIAVALIMTFPQLALWLPRATGLLE